MNNKIPAYLRHIAERCVGRIDAMQLGNGKRASDAALHYFIGAIAGLEAAGHEKAAQHVGAVTTLLISVRGIAEVRRLAQGDET